METNENKHISPKGNQAIVVNQAVEIKTPGLSEYAARRKQALEEFEKQHLREILEKARGNVARAARESGVARQRLFAKIKKLSVDPNAFRKHHGQEQRNNEQETLSGGEHDKNTK